MKRLALTCLLFIATLLNGFVQAQPTSYSTKNNKAIKHYEESQKFIALNQQKSVDMLNSAIEKDYNFIEAHALLAELLAYNGKFDKAIEQYNITFSINPNFYQNNYFFAGRLELKLGKYKEAKEHFEKYISARSVNHKMDDEANLYIKSCDFAIESMAHALPFNPLNIGPEINTSEDEYFPTITADDQMFLFTRKLSLPAGASPYGLPYQEDFFYSTKQNGKWTTARGIGNNINTPLNEGAPSLSADGNYLFFVACSDDNNYGAGRQGFGSCDIFVSRKMGDKWVNPHNIGSPVNTRAWETQPSFSSDGKTLYFVRGIINEQGHKQGDIYMAQLKADGKFSHPVRLGKNINTPFHEESVFIHPDNQTLYFSSNGRVGMGGLDIYMSKRGADGQWGEAVNLGYPINTFNDENSLLVDSKGKLAYFASNRAGGIGGLDIYTLEVDSKFKPENMTYLKGKVYDSKTKKPLNASFELIELDSGKTVMQSESNQLTGEFLVCLPTNKNYALNVSKAGYLFYSENFSLKETKDISKPFMMDVPLQPIDTGVTVQLKNIFFETNKFDLKPESKAELQKLISFLNLNSTLKIELSGHTDNTGDKKFNTTLSHNRAKSVYDYLIANGIATDRLLYKGYGDTKPVAPNDTPENKQKNRRTEFKVIGK
ncbi:MAG: PD40 domain-containing protein [Bacteroidia bacterium]|nr:PD40 domain-containing protein [Bacteroidia bacterium]